MVKKYIKLGHDVGDAALLCLQSIVVRIVRLAVHPVGHTVAIAIAAVPTAAFQRPVVVAFDPARLNIGVAGALALPMAFRPHMLGALPPQ